MCLLTETRALSAQGEKRALVGNLTMPAGRPRPDSPHRDGTRLGRVDIGTGTAASNREVFGSLLEPRRGNIEIHVEDSRRPAGRGGSSGTVPDAARGRRRRRGGCWCSPRR